MLSVQPEQARTLSAIVTHGTFDAAAAQLSVTPSAVSQRIRALEVAVGRPVLRRLRPVELTEAGQAVVRFARQLDLLSMDLADELDLNASPARPRLVVVINSDSLNTWALPGLAAVAGSVQLEVLREDQEHSLDLLRSGIAAAAITAAATPVPGCSSRRLGVMRYWPVCSREFVERWFPSGVTASTLPEAPVITYDRRDDLQDRYLDRYQLGPDGRSAPRHYIPAAQEFADAIRLGMGWGMLPDMQVGREVEQGTLQRLDSNGFVDVALHWQQWRHGAAALAKVATAISEAARVLRQEESSGVPS